MAILVNLKKLLGAVVIISLSLPLYSAVLKHETTKLKLHDYTYLDFCESMKAKNSTLITATNSGELECLNQKISIVDFCIQKNPLAKFFTRGYAVDKEKKVYCEEGQSVMVSVSCDTRDLHYCFDPKKGCEQLQKIYANRLEVVHYSMLEKNLNCYFAKPLGENLDEI
jgi:hypothetical protein